MMCNIQGVKHKRKKKSIQMIMAYAIGMAVFIWDAIILALLF